MVLSAVLLAIPGAGASEFAGSYVGGKVGSNNSSISGVGAAPGKNTTTYGLEGGHGWDVDNVLLGVDGFYDSNRQSTHSATSDYGSNVSGLGLKAGFPMNRLMPYARLGYAHVGGTGTASGFSHDDVFSGFGLEYKFAPNWSVAGEWTTVAPIDNGTKLKNQNFTIGVSYYFRTPKAAPAAVAPVVAKEEPPKVEPKPEPMIEPKPQPKESWRIIKEQKPVTLEGALFDFDSSRLRPTAAAKLQAVVDFANKYPDAGMDVGGYTDNVGMHAYNQKLSERRAASVKAYLVKKGIDASRITTKGYGETEPVADNKTKAGRQANRRVEVHYVIMEEKKIRAGE